MKGKNDGKSYEEKAFEKYGDIDMIDTWGKKYERLNQFAVYKFDQKYFSGVGYEFEDWERPILARKKLGEEFRVGETAGESGKVIGS